MKSIGNSPRPDWFTAHDARILGRLRTGLANQADLCDASANFLPVARRIYAAALSDRQAVTDDWLGGCIDAEAIKLAVIDTDPAGPPALAVGPEAAVRAAIGVEARLTCAADIQPRVVEWLWTGRVPLGMLTMFAGDPKLGKSYVTLALAAAVSRGAAMPFGAVPDAPGSVIVMSAEDDPSRTIIPRLQAAGADLAKIHILESVILGNGHESPLCLDTDIHAIAAAAARLGDCRLILIDPISAYMGDIDDHRNAEVRGVLSPLNDAAERLRVAVVLINHLSKGGGSNGKHRVMGSVAYVGVCRANLIFVRDRTDPTGRRILIGDNGGNLAPTSPTLAFTIEDRLLGPCVEFLPDPVPITTEQALGDEAHGTTDRHQAPERREAELWLKEVLAAGPLPAKDVEESAKKCGLSLRTLNRAKETIGVISTRQGFAKDARWTWKLLDPAAQDRPSP